MSENNNKFQAINPATNSMLDGEFFNASNEEINKAVESAEKAFKIYKNKSTTQIADFLDSIAEEIMNLGDTLINRCHLETALPMGRLQGERGRTVNQLKLFASVVREGSWVDARIDIAEPDRAPIPKPDIRHMLKPLGPVAVFGASNFPLAFSVAGGDTASALAAGCPVVVKAHPAHPGTSALIAEAINTAIEKSNMPKGTFSLVQGNTIEVGGALVKHPLIKAVGFTGSFGGGKALFDIANARPEPIPVFAEMGSTNPVFFLPEALNEKADALAKGLAGSIALGVGQFCTNPGLNFVQKSESSDTFVKTLADEVSGLDAATMLTPAISKTYKKGVKNTNGISGVDEVATGNRSESVNTAEVTVFKTAIDTYFKNETLAEENFGPSSILVEVNTKEDILKAATELEGHLTATVHGTDSDLENYKELFEILEQKVGRVIVNGYPTGVEVCHAMVHGGPFPATTAAQSTSVGTNAIKRFARPVCFQNYPQALLPMQLKDENKLNLWRLVNGEITKNSI